MSQPARHQPALEAFLPRPDPARAFHRVRDFMIVVATVEADATRSAHSRAQEISEHYARSLDDLAAAGQLTDAVRRQLEEQTRLAVAQLGQLTDEFGDRLATLARAYRAPQSQSLAAQVVGFSAVSLVGFLLLVALGVGPVGVLVAILAVGCVAAVKLQIERDRAAG